jgi:hypothetical protein
MGLGGTVAVLARADGTETRPADGAADTTTL